jgi:hypothetical protein
VVSAIDSFWVADYLRSLVADNLLSALNAFRIADGGQEKASHS